MGLMEFGSNLTLLIKGRIHINLPNRKMDRFNFNPFNKGFKLNPNKYISNSSHIHYNYDLLVILQSKKLLITILVHFSSKHA